MTGHVTRSDDQVIIIHNIKMYRQYRESGFVDLVFVKEKLQEIWEIINRYTNQDIYNIDKSVLFWKMILDKKLKIEYIGKLYLDPIHLADPGSN